MGIREPRPTQKLLDLQRLRAIAIFMVLFGHTPLRMPNALIHGYTGVSLFFVISGYVVTLGFVRHPPEHSALSKSWSYLRDFYLRRFFRIIPVACFWVLFSVAVVELLPRIGGANPWTANPWWVEVAWIASGFYNYLFAVSRSPGLFGHFWSLAVEMHFYLVLPIALLLFRTRRQRILLCVVAVLLVSTLLRLATPPNLVGLLTHTQADALLMGVLICVVTSSSTPTARSRRVPQYAKHLVFAGLALALFLLPARLDGSWSPLLKYPLYTAIASLMVFLAQRDTGWVFGGIPGLTGFLEYAGDRSYSLYLCHPILWIAMYTYALAKYPGSLPHWFTSSLAGTAVQFSVLFFAALLVADLSYRHVELPLIARGKRLVARLEARRSLDTEATAFNEAA